MIFGAIGGLLAATGYTLVTGKLQLTKKRIVYGTPARAVALLSLAPLGGLIVYVAATGRTVLQPGGLGLFLGTIIACVAIIYAAGWPLGELPRD